MADPSFVDTSPTTFSDPLSVAGFRFYVNRLPKISFAVQAINLPSLTLSEWEMPTPFTRTPLAGEHIDYGDFRVTYLVDNQLSNYIEIHDWIRALGKPTSFDDYAAVRMEPGTGVASDCTLVVLDAKRNPAAIVTLREAVPTSLSEITFDSRLPGQRYAEVTATFRYTEFEIELA